MNPKSLPEAGSPPRTWPPEQGHWTFEDWLRLPDDGFRYEVLNGELFTAPPPNISHQRSSSRLLLRMALHATTKGLGEVFHPPTGVKIPGQPVPVQPDILFVSRERKSIIGKEYIEGAVAGLEGDGGRPRRRRPCRIGGRIAGSTGDEDRKENRQARHEGPQR
jgi:hypothetical protein